jgi:cobalt-zinc-cadmium efflux system outer membrane protein
MTRLFIAFLALTAVAGAAELTLDQAVDHALANNRTLAATGPYEIQLAEARALQAGLPKNPELEIGGRSDLLFGNDGERTLSLGISQSLARRNRLQLARDSAKLAVTEQKARARDDARLLVGDVQTLYVELLGIDAQRAARQRLIETGQQLAAVVEQRIRAGEVPQTDLAPIRIENAKLAQAQQLLRVEQAAREIDLKLALGLPAAEPLVLKGSLEEAVKHWEETVPATVTADRPDRQAAQARIAQAEAGIRVAQAEVYDDITVGVDIETERTAGDLSGLRNDHFLGFKVTIPLPTRNRNQGRIREQETARRQSVASLAAVEQRIAAEIARGRATLEQIEPLLARYRSELVPMAEAHFQTVQRAYEQGQIGIPQVFQAQQQRAELELDYQAYLARKAAALVAIETAAGTNPRLKAALPPLSSQP